MSITSPDERISTYNPVVPTTEFAANFPVFDNSDLKVVHDGVERTDFTVTATYIDGISTDAKAVFLLGITGHVQVVGAREPHRTNRFKNGAPLPIRDQNLALDTLESEVQELARNISRAPLSPYGVPGPRFPIPEGSMLIGWDGSGNLENKVSESASQAAAEAAAAAALAAANAGFVFDTHAEFLTANIPAILMFVQIAGYHAPGDGGGHMRERSTALDIFAEQSADGSWWAPSVPPSGRISVKAFGARVDGASDDSAAITKALQFSSEHGVEIHQPVGTSMTGAVITIPDGAAWCGVNFMSVVKKLPTYAGAMLKSENFDALTGTGDAFAPGVPETISVDQITFNGNYQSEDRSIYIQSSGDGCKLFVRKPYFRARIFNMQGEGFFCECPNGNGPTPLRPGYSRQALIDLYIHGTQHEGMIWKGPADVRMDHVFQTDAGSRIASEEGNGQILSPRYGGMLYGVVVDGIGAEIGFIHSWGNLAGSGIRWNGGRINGDLLMAETCRYGGMKIEGAAYGAINTVDVHRTGGFNGDTTPDFIYDGAGNNNVKVKIKCLSLYRANPAYTTPRNGAVITGDFLEIGNFEAEGSNTAGHALVLENDTAQWVSINGGDISRWKGAAPDGLESSAVYRKTVGNGSLLNVKANVRDCGVALRSAGTPRVETIDLQFFLNAGQLVFAGDLKTQPGQRWDIRGTVNSVFVGSKNKGVSVAFNSNTTVEQDIVIPHSLMATPPLGSFWVNGVSDTGTGITAGAFQYVYAYNADATNIYAKVKLSTANGSDTQPRLNWGAEI
jgi:hypothetical protein